MMAVLPPGFPFILTIDIHGDENLARDTFIPGKVVKFEVLSFEQNWGWGNSSSRTTFKLVPDDPDDWYEEQVKLMAERAPA